MDFPDGPVAHNLPANAGYLGLTPAGQLSLSTATTEAHTLEPVLGNKRSHCNEKPTHHNEE